MLLLVTSIVAAAPPRMAAPRCACLASSCDISYELPPDIDLCYVEIASPDRPDKPFALMTTLSFPAHVDGLAAGREYSFAVRCHNASSPSIAWGPSWGAASPRANCVVAREHDGVSLPQQGSGQGSRPTQSRFMRAYRISEFSFSVDFLGNHDAASVEAMPLYLMTCSPEGMCSPWSTADHTQRWDACQRALEFLCPDGRGAAFTCLDCAERHRTAVEAACGSFTPQDSLAGEGSFGVHWFCGVGWPESTAEQGPITEYCIEYEPLAVTAATHGDGTGGADFGGDGFSGYLSCNSDETDGLVHNDPRDPRCICICLDDRLLGHQTLAELERDCFHSGTIPWVNETICRCPGGASEVPAPTNPSLHYIGRAPVYLPYVGNALKPVKRYPASILGGYNYHFPRGGECAEGQPLGTARCKWRRLPTARMLYGADLLAAGWNRTFVADTPTDQRHTLANVAAFSGALRALDALVQLSPCQPPDSYIGHREPGSVRGLMDAPRAADMAAEAAGAPAEGHACPDYSQIRQSSVDAGAFDIAEFAGRWYMVATTEPTLPSFCRCGVNEVRVRFAEGRYEYTNTDHCELGGFNRSVSLHIHGKLSTDPRSPGLLHENAALFNHTIGKLDANFIFRADRNAAAELTAVFTYACLGRLPPVVGRNCFSFNVLSRTPYLTRATIESLVESANRSVSSAHLLDLSGLRIDDADAFRACGL